MNAYKMLIDGQLVAGARTIDVVNPATGQPFTAAPVADEGQLNAAVAAARHAFPAWAATSWSERRDCLLFLAQRLEEEAEDFARLLVKEQGKPLPEARFEIGATVQGMRYYASVELSAETRSHVNGSYQIDRRPLGVVAAITPWNYPLILASNKFAPALLTGNTVILKPAPTTPLTSLELGRLASEIFPRGVFNVIADENDLGPSLTGHPDIAKISFTGSTGTGKRVMQGAVETLKRVTLELGGNDPAIVLKDADVERAAQGLAATAFLNAGQICAAPKRLYVADEIYDAFCERLVAAARALKLGAGDEDGVTIGPIQNNMQFNKVREIIEEAAAQGRVLTGGHITNRPGFFIEPTVIADLADEARLVADEQFGPVVPVLRFSDEREAISRANTGPYGLGASIWSRDVDRARTLARDLEAGTVWINQHVAIQPDIPFSGAKQSGVGTEGGIEGVREFTRLQVINAAA
ncbi:aldehyde dehydrogenase [Sphingopyxis sp. H038]|jgi:acyl-CoA reductase-like NAD-dependent aldehyde dehydrogenase|uniref:aldehyde dehydrogenase family protein n=1 Tax=unclassified Sphingopyxis TaxID=2614943 RepID=UPI00072FB372|nr:MULTISPECIES: aldehyde dehydrogenase family protein [unclassified Sphingopyxis]KTE00752.1 aldehyde dehydrogenase [Sphingopyxis sp. H012]KTE11698.1 aldehyde dehydrogenase [Sphingopyxis sp. H053]KTE16398.1 aldehyde dehydrogenase [Sphingopyxis sp. H093]KTE28541.1 aldehyde dehydrogenase [Sphingopyxis sp. H080]KTE33404.1 aldehyde dehydrogenase [Sphingopyxis sp. H038]